MQDKMITMSYKGIVIMFYLIYLQTYIHCWWYICNSVQNYEKL